MFHLSLAKVASQQTKETIDLGNFMAEVIVPSNSQVNLSVAKFSLTFLFDCL